MSSRCYGAWPFQRDFVLCKVVTIAVVASAAAAETRTTVTTLRLVLVTSIVGAATDIAIQGVLLHHRALVAKYSAPLRCVDIYIDMYTQEP